MLRIKQANNKTLSLQRPHDLLTDVSAEPEGACSLLAVGKTHSTVSMNSLMGTDEGTKQYERFRDTIFLNYWAIVFVKDVEFFFSGFIIVLFVSFCDDSFLLNVQMVVLRYFFTIGYF